MMQTKNILVVVCLSFCVYSSFAGASGYVQKSIQSVEEEVRRQFGDGVLQKMYDYRIEIQKNAYAETMKLCPVYRIAAGMGLPPYHKKLKNSYYVQHESPEVRDWALQMNRQYGKDIASSLQAWLYVMYEGGVQSFSALFETGMKGDYINITQASFFESRRWFYSLYTLYLTDSLGFLQAAMHCLGTISEEEINQFALTVLGVDAAMSTAGYTVTLWTGEQVFGLIFKGIQWASRPLTKRFVSWLHRMNISPSTVKKYAVAGGITALGGLGIWTVSSLNKTQEEEELLQRMIQEEISRMMKEQEENKNQ